MTSSDTAAAALRADYLNRLDQALARVPHDLAADLRIELAGHLDAVAGGGGASPAEAMQAAIARLGDPEQFLAELIADDQVREASRGFAPAPLLRSLTRRAAVGGWRGLVAAGLLLTVIAAIALVLVGVLSPFFPHHVGLLEFADGRTTFGITSEAAARERLGLWRLPIGVAGGVMVWLMARYFAGRIAARR